MKNNVLNLNMKENYISCFVSRLQQIITMFYFKSVDYKVCCAQCMIDNSFLKFIFLKYDTLCPLFKLFFFLIMQESQILKIVGYAVRNI